MLKNLSYLSNIFRFLSSYFLINTIFSLVYPTIVFYLTNYEKWNSRKKGNSMTKMNEFFYKSYLSKTTLRLFATVRIPPFFIFFQLTPRKWFLLRPYWQLFFFRIMELTLQTKNYCPCYDLNKFHKSRFPNLIRLLVGCRLFQINVF